MKTLLASVWILSMGSCAAQTPAVPSTMPTLKHIQALRAQGRVEVAAAEMEKMRGHLLPDGKQMFYREYAEGQWSAGHLNGVPVT